MVRLHTAQLNIGKQLKNQPTAFFLDITVKSGGQFVHQYLAPSWDLLQRYKRKECTSEEYSREYLSHLDAHRETIVMKFHSFAKYLNLNDLVLGCYCGAGEFCHRHLLQRWLLAHCDCFEMGGEVGPGNIYRGDEPTKMVLSIVGDVEFRQSVRKEYPCVLSSHEFFEYPERGETLVSDYVRDGKAELIEFALKRFKCNLGPVIDLSGLGTILNTCSDEVHITHLVSPELPDWRVVQGDLEYVLKYILEHRFAPAFEITVGSMKSDFVAELDNYYASHYSKM